MLADDTGRRGLELRRGGETFGGGAIIFARRDGDFWPCEIDGAYGLLPGDFMRIGACAVRFGVVGLVAPLGVGIALPEVGFAAVYFPIFEADRDDGLEWPDSDVVLGRRLLTGIRECKSRFDGVGLELPIT